MINVETVNTQFHIKLLKAWVMLKQVFTKFYHKTQVPWQLPVVTFWGKDSRFPNILFVLQEQQYTCCQEVGGLCMALQVDPKEVLDLEEV